MQLKPELGMKIAKSVVGNGARNIITKPAKRICSEL
jgi:hypothetical protein